jgi:hypothetical protein
LITIVSTEDLEVFYVEQSDELLPDLEESLSDSKDKSLPMSTIDDTESSANVVPSDLEESLSGSEEHEQSLSVGVPNTVEKLWTNSGVPVEKPDNRPKPVNKTLGEENTGRCGLTRFRVVVLLLIALVVVLFVSVVVVVLTRDTAEVLVTSTSVVADDSEVPLEPTDKDTTSTSTGTCGSETIGNGICPNLEECCSQWGNCDIAYCSSVTASATNAPASSTTDGTCGGGSIGNGYCRISNECCSKFGWCGTSAEHCGNGGTVTEETPTDPDA